MSERMLTVGEIAQMLHVSRATAYRMAQHLPMVRVGRSIRIAPSALRRALRDFGGEIPTSGPSNGGGRDE